MSVGDCPGVPEPGVLAFRRQLPWAAGPGGTNVTFALSNSLAGSFSVEYTTHFADWNFLRPAISRYLFTDTNVPALPQRFYRLRWT